MTDSEVIKALNIALQTESNVINVRLQDECESNPFYSAIAKYALDLLKRQKTEIERLKSMNQAKLDRIHNLQKENEILSRNADTAFQDGLNERRDLFAPEIKAEAYKEFATKIYQAFAVENTRDGCLDFTLNYTRLMECVDNVLKELVGDDK